MTYSISGYNITGRLIGRSQDLDQNGRRYYRLYSNGVVYEVSEPELRDVQ